MLKTNFDPASKVLVLEPEGKLEASDFQSVAALVDPFISEKGSLQGLLVRSKFFPGWKDFEAFTTHLRFVGDHHKKIKKIAVVTDSKLGDFMSGIGKHFLSAELKHFAFDEEAAARAWIAAE
jgi:stage II sporulation SpoAA-like protein